MKNNDYVVDVIKKIEQFTTYAESKLLPFLFEKEDSFERLKKYHFKRRIIIHHDNKDVSSKLLIIANKSGNNFKYELIAQIYRKGEYNGEYHLYNHIDDSLIDFIKSKINNDEDIIELDNITKVALYIVSASKEISWRKLIYRLNKFYNSLSYEEISKSINILLQNGFVSLYNLHGKNIFIYPTAKARKIYKPFIFQKLFYFTFAKRNLPHIIDMYSYVKVYNPSYLIAYPELEGVFKHE
ncbi:MAG: hypothetical protein HUJ61_04860 [Bacilli bacterium]|nr:hypothetical protein [Bacilli bacterium]